MIYFLLLWQHGNEIGQSAEDAAAEGESHGEGIQHLYNIWTDIAQSNGFGEFWHEWINVIYSIFIMLALVIILASVAKNLKKIPGRFQNFVELIFSAFDGLTSDILGHKNGRKYVPLIGSLFLYILIMNLNGLLPAIGYSPSANLNITLSLALFVFITVHIHGIRELSFTGYLKHYAGFPSHGKPSVIDWCMAPMMFPLHIIGELARPVSLSLRLFGNITGEDVLILIFVTLVTWIPLQFFMYPIALLGSTIQAIVFAMLSMIYILSMSHHEEETH